MSAGLRAFAERALGDFHVAADCSWEHRASAVLRLRDADGASWYPKRHSEPERYVAELNAYRAWVPALGDRAPRLLAASDDLRAMLLSEVPGRSAIAGEIGCTPPSTVKPENCCGAFTTPRNFHYGRTLPRRNPSRRTQCHIRADRAPECDIGAKKRGLILIQGRGPSRRCGV